MGRAGVHIALFHGSELGRVAYHRPRDADTNTYPGNPEPLSFGEDGERGVVLATVPRSRLLKALGHED